MKTLLNLSKGEKAASSAAKKPFSFSTHHQTWQGKDTANNFFLKENFENEKNDFLWLASVLSVPIAAENPGDYKKKIGGFAPRKWGRRGSGGSHRKFQVFATKKDSALNLLMDWTIQVVK